MLMRLAMVLAALTVFASAGCAAGTYDSYDAFYSSRPGTLFDHPVRHAAGLVSSFQDQHGIHRELRTKLGGIAVWITLAENRMTVNGVIYRYARAAMFPGEHPSAFSPQSADVFVARRTGTRPAVLCVQGDSNGSGESDRHKQIYLLIDPLAPKGRETFLHLPSLLSSCRAVSETKDGRLVFPGNRYLLDDAQVLRVGLLMSYYAFEGGRFTPVPFEVRLRFIRPENPFRFLVQEKCGCLYCAVDADGSCCSNCGKRAR